MWLHAGFPFSTSDVWTRLCLVKVQINLLQFAMSRQSRENMTWRKIFKTYNAASAMFEEHGSTVVLHEKQIAFAFQHLQHVGPLPVCEGPVLFSPSDRS